MGPHYFTKMFKPHSVAVFNASAQANTAGTVVIRNLVQGQFKGPVYTIDINQKVVQELNTYGSLKEVGNQVDLAIITTSANTVPGIIKECGRLGTRTAIIPPAHARGASRDRHQWERTRHHGERPLG